MNCDIILISGKQGSGKTSLAKGLIQNIPNSYHLKFADPLYEMHESLRAVANKYNIQFDQKEGKLLQYLGTEWGRITKGHNVWVDAMTSRVAKIYADCEKIPTIIIDDARFENEFDAFPDAFSIRLRASSAARKIRADGWRDTENHPSEVGLDDYVTQGKFKLNINTEEMTKEQTLQFVLSKIL